jgi:hypothetical protein
MINIVRQRAWRLLYAQARQPAGQTTTALIHHAAAIAARV